MDTGYSLPPYFTQYNPFVIWTSTVIRVQFLPPCLYLQPTSCTPVFQEAHNQEWGDRREREAEAIENSAVFTPLEIACNSELHN